MANAKHSLPTPGVSLSAKARRTHEAPISALIAAALGNPDLISFAAGLVDPLTLPVEECRAITQKIFSDRHRGQVALQYDTTLGLRPLRHELLKHLNSLEGKELANVTPDDLLVTTGSQQALYLVADTLLDPGDIVIAANPSYFVFMGSLQSLGARVVTVPMDSDGMDVEAVETVLEKLAAEGSLPRVKFIYCTSYYQNPTGLSLSLERRKRLVQVAQSFSRSHRILIVEDAAYRELRYDGPALPSIKGFDETNEFVVLTQTFSKPFAPGIKLGYTVVPRGLMDPLLQQKGNHDFGSANLCMQIALETLRDGSYLKHLDVLKREYQRKRDAMLEALKRHMPREKPEASSQKSEGGSGQSDEATKRRSDEGGSQHLARTQDSALRTQYSSLKWTIPNGGLYVWLTLPPGVDTSRGKPLFAQCVDRGVLYVPGEYCFQPDAAGHLPRHHMRLSFGQVALEKIDEGIERLADVIKRILVPIETRKTKLENTPEGVQR